MIIIHVIQDSFKKIKNDLMRLSHSYINFRNRQRLRNLNPSIICSDCTGGIISNWLRLKHNSPFVNLYMNNHDFLTALENFDEFIEGEILEDKIIDKPFPVGIGNHGERIYFMHYPDFKTALHKWNERKKRINKNNMGIILSNFGEGLNNEEEIESIIDRFNKLPFKNKVIFIGDNYRSNCCFKLKGFNLKDCINVCYYNRFGKRYIDQYNYVNFFNSFSDGSKNSTGKEASS